MSELEQAIRQLIDAGAIRTLDPETGWIAMHGNHFWIHDDGISDIFGVHINLSDDLLRELSEAMQASCVAPLWLF